MLVVDEFTSLTRDLGDRTERRTNKA